MADLVTWLLEQIAEDEQHAVNMSHPNPCAGQWPCLCSILEGEVTRLRAECDAKRRIIAKLTYYHDEVTAMRRDKSRANDLLRLLALPYADREGFRAEWRP